MPPFMPDKVLLSLVRYALGTQNAEVTVNQCRELEPSLWKEVYALARQQTVTGLMYQALSKLPARMSVPEDFVFSLAAQSARVEQRSAAVQKQAETMLGGLRRAGLSPVLMKGPAVAAFYPKPLLRESGDIDLFFTAAELPSALMIFKKKGYAPVLTSDGSYFCDDRPASVDIHSRYIDLHVSPALHPGIPSPEATLLMLDAHILKHAMGPGVGLRQLCDMAMALRALDGQYDKDKFRQLCHRCGIGRWTRMVTCFVREELGLDVGLYPAGMPYGALYGVVFGGGDFGHHAPGRRSALSASSARRKVDTAIRFMKKASFGLQYAPREYLDRFGELVRGNVQLSDNAQ